MNCYLVIRRRYMAIEKGRMIGILEVKSKEGPSRDDQSSMKRPFPAEQEEI